MKTTMQIKKWLQTAFTISTAFLTTNTYAQELSSESWYSYYVNDSERVFACPLNSDGTLNKCTVTSLDAGTALEGIAFYMLNDVTYAYVVDALAANVRRCTVNTENGALTDCLVQQIPGATTLGFGVAFQNVFDQNYIYVSDIQGNQVYSCALDVNTGEFLRCNSNPVNAPVRTVFSNVGGETYAYVTSLAPEGKVFVCKLNCNGTFQGCKPAFSEHGIIWNSNGMAFHSSSGINFAYIADPAKSTVFKCTVCPQDGMLAGCLAQGYFESTTSVSFVWLENTPYVYVGAIGGSQMKRCEVNKRNGEFINCAFTSHANVFDMTVVRVIK